MHVLFDVVENEAEDITVKGVYFLLVERETSMRGSVYGWWVSSSCFREEVSLKVLLDRIKLQEGHLLLWAGGAAVEDFGVS